MGLDKGHIQCFQDLVDAFIKKYKYNLDMEPDHRQLKNMSQSEKESFKEYAQRWRELASQVEPPLAEKELTGFFMDTLYPFFWDKMIGSVSSSFTGLVTIGQRLEEGIKNGKVSKAAESCNGAKKYLGKFQKKKEVERGRPQYIDQPPVADVTPAVNA